MKKKEVLKSTVMKKEEVLEVLKKRNIKNHYLINDSINEPLLVVVCQDITWKELKVIGKNIIDITTWDETYIRIAIELD